MALEKKDRLIYATIALSVLILVIGMLVVVFQTVSISNKKKELRALRVEQARLEQMIEEGSSDIAILEQKATIEELARRLGYKYPDDVEKG